MTDIFTQIEDLIAKGTEKNRRKVEAFKKAHPRGMTSSELRGYFLEIAPVIVDSLIAEGLDNDGKLVNTTAGDALRKAIFPIIEQANELRRIEITSIADIVRSAADGKISVKEAKELIQLFRDAKPALMEDELMSDRHD
jgi:hypothetical protein